jgi:ribosomal protein S18 acetylase RimI-like enzyme
MSEPTAQFIISVPTPDDVLPMIEMHAQSWKDTYPNDDAGVTLEWVEERTKKWFTPENIENRKKRLEEAKTNPDIATWIAKDKAGKIIGIASPRRDEKGQHVGAIYVDKEYHGQGIAQQLMEKIIDWSDPGQPIDLEVASYNERAKAFYRKYGFQETGKEAHFAEVIPVVTMIRKGDNQ